MLNSTRGVWKFKDARRNDEFLPNYQESIKLFECIPTNLHIKVKKKVKKEKKE